MDAADIIEMGNQCRRCGCVLPDDQWSDLCDDCTDWYEEEEDC